MFEEFFCYRRDNLAGFDAFLEPSVAIRMGFISKVY
jgi:hypothetical protein